MLATYQGGNRTDVDRSKSLTIFGANSHHSIPTSCLSFRETYALSTPAHDDGGGIWIRTAMSVLSLNSQSAFMSAPLKLRFFTHPPTSAEALADTCTGRFSWTRSPQRCS